MPNSAPSNRSTPFFLQATAVAADPVEVHVSFSLSEFKTPGVVDWVISVMKIDGGTPIIL